MSEINYKEQFEIALESLRDISSRNIELSREVRHLKRDLFKARSRVLSDEEFHVMVWSTEDSKFTNRGSFEHSLHGEELGGGLWFDQDGRLIDYDGVYSLPSKVVDTLLSEDFIVQEH